MRGAKWKIAQSNWNRSSRPREGRGSASSRTNIGSVQRNIYPGCSHLSRALPLLSKTTAHSPRQAFGSVLLPGAPASPTTSSADPSSAPDTATAAATHALREQVSASARVARAFVIPTPPAIREQPPLRPSCLFAPATAFFSPSPCFRDTKAPTRSIRFRI
jgi:hypothetical protein